jgi:hypothetical protein
MGRGEISSDWRNRKTKQMRFNTAQIFSLCLMYSHCLSPETKGLAGDMEN